MLFEHGFEPDKTYIEPQVFLHGLIILPMFLITKRLHMAMTFFVMMFNSLQLVPVC